MAGRADGISHIVQAVEAGDEVIVLAGKGRGRRYLKCDAVAELLLLRDLARSLDRFRVIVEAKELRIGKCFGHENGRCAMSAADVGYARARPQLCLYPFERRDPFAEQMRQIVGAEKSLAPDEEAFLVLVPAKALAGAEDLRQFLFVLHARGEHVVETGKIEGGV